MSVRSFRFPVDNKLIGVIEHPIAKNFDILDGAVTITVPDVQPGKTYKLVRECPAQRNILIFDATLVFGDSGNDSQAFEITV